MENRRYYLSLLGESFENRGARLNDSVILNPVVGRKRMINLNRTAYTIKSFEGNKTEISDTTIFLPKWGHRDFNFDLRLCHPLSENKSEHRMRYLLKAKSNTPFRHNGSLCFEAFLERGDTIVLGYNKLKIKHPSDMDSSVSMDIICPKFIKSNLNILIEGETGTGKTTLAKKIHEESQREGEFVHLNLASFSNSLIESELFGHCKGAFTGATHDKIGALVQANHGTLFLDEVDSMPLETQLKLLLFLDDGKVRQVGAGNDKKVDVRFIFAAGSSLYEKVRKGSIRKDFYYRISSGVSVKLKPLRKNKKLIQDTLNDFSLKQEVFLEEKLTQFYLDFPWPGNLRQLLGHLNKKVVYSKRSRLVFDELDEALSKQSIDIEEALEEIVPLKKLKCDYALRVLHKFDGNIKQASQAIGVTPKTLRSLVLSRQ